MGIYQVHQAQHPSTDRHRHLLPLPGQREIGSPRVIPCVEEERLLARCKSPTSAWEDWRGTHP